MKKLLLLSLMASACAQAAAPVDKDGVPVVNLHGAIVEVKVAQQEETAKKFRTRVPKRRMITVGEKQMPLDEFMRTYCQGKFQNETCARGASISRIDSSRGPVEKLPKGL